MNGGELDHRVVVASGAAVDALSSVTLSLTRRLSDHLSEERHGRAGGLYRSRGWMKSPRISTGLAVFGERGAGKTTVLQATLARVEAEFSGNPPWFALEHLVDLSLAPSGFPLGLCVVDAIHAGLPPSRGSETAQRLARAAYDKVRAAYLRRSVGYNEVLRQLAMSPEDYRQRGAEEVREAAALPESVAQWLEAECAARQLGGVVVGLDDADLVREDGSEWVMWPFLDELHQARLLVAFSADQRRLLSAGCRDRSRGIDRSTAAEVLRKVCPLGQQVRMDALGVEDARSMLRFASGGARVSQYVAWSDPDPAWDALLPRNPRKLEELSGAGDAPDVTAFLAALARTHGHDHLADALVSRDAVGWAASLAWPDAGAPPWAAGAVRESEAPHLVPSSPCELPLDDVPRAGLWVERLLDAAVSDGAPGAMERLSLRIPGLAAALDAATVQIAYPRRDVQDWLVRISDRVEDGGDDGKAAEAELAWVRWTIQDEDTWLAHVGLRAYVELAAGARRVVGRALAGELSRELLEAAFLLDAPPVLPARVRAVTGLGRHASRLPFELIASPAFYRDPSEAVRLVVALLLRAGLDLVGAPPPESVPASRAHLWSVEEAAEHSAALLAAVGAWCGEHPVAASDVAALAAAAAELGAGA